MSKHYETYLQNFIALSVATPTDVELWRRISSRDQKMEESLDWHHKNGDGDSRHNYLTWIKLKKNFIRALSILDIKKSDIQYEKLHFMKPEIKNIWALIPNLFLRLAESGRRERL